MNRTFCDNQAGAYECARNLKASYRQSIIEIRDRSTGRKVMMLEDGRTA